MATLTIKGDGKGSFAAFNKLNLLITNAEKSTIRLANISKSLGGHYRTAAFQVGELRKRIDGVAQATIKVSGQAKSISGHFQSAIAGARGFSSAVEDSSRSVIATASATKSIARHQQGVTAEIQRSSRAMDRLRIKSSRSFVSNGAPLSRGPSRSSLPVIAQSAGGIQGAIKGAFSTVGRLTKGVFGGLKKAFSGGILSGGKAGFLGIAPIGLGVVNGIASGLLSALTAVFKTVFRLAKTGLKVAFTAAAAFLGNSIRLAIKKEPLEQAFGSITKSNGLGDQVEVLNDLRKASKGTISDLQLMANANSAVFLGAAKTTEQLGFLIEAGRRLGKATGRTATEGFNDLSLGIGRQSKLILDNLGLLVGVEAANKKYAASLGTTADKLTDVQKKTAFQTAAFDAIKSKLKELGEEQLTARDRISQLGASFSNLSSDVGEKFLPQISALSERWSEFVSGLRSDDVAGFFSGIGDAIKGMTTSALDFAFSGELRKGFTDLGDSIFQAFTDPSKEAFSILGIQIKAFSDLAVSRFREMWDKFKSLAASAGKVALSVLTGGKTITGSGSAQRDLIGARAESDRVGIRSGAASRIAGLQEIIDERRENRDARARLRSGSGTGSQFGITRARIAPPAGGGQRIKQADPLASAATTAATTAAANKDLASAARAAASALRAQDKVLRDAQRSAESRISKREDIERALRESTSNLSAAIKGIDVERSLGQKLDDAASQLRGFNDVLAEASFDVAESKSALKLAFEEITGTIAQAGRQFAEDLKRQAKSFLLGGEVEGTTTRVRSLQRKARREQRRKNKSIFQSELGSQGFGGQLGGNFGGFGAQGVERSGGLLEKGVPGLESALAQLINSDGSTLLLDLQSEIAEIVREGNEQLAILDADRKQALEFQKEAIEARNELQQEAINLEKEAVALLKGDVKEIARLRDELGAIKKDLDQVRRLARSR